MEIKLGTNNSEKVRLTKDITYLLDLEGYLKSDTSILDPEVIISRGSTSFSDIASCNYMEIPEFNRKYFITGIKSVSADLVQISGHVDVLSTYAEDIRSNKAIVKRQELRYNTLLDDGSFMVYQNPVIKTKSFPSGFGGWYYVLALAGS